MRLTRPTDDETAVLAGLDAAIGDYVVNLSYDFDPPAELVAMVEACRTGSDLVLGVDRHPVRPSFAYWALRGVFLALGRWVVRLDVMTGTGAAANDLHAEGSADKKWGRRRSRVRTFEDLTGSVGAGPCVLGHVDANMGFVHEVHRRCRRHVHLVRRAGRGRADGS